MATKGTGPTRVDRRARPSVLRLVVGALIVGAAFADGGGQSCSRGGAQPWCGPTDNLMFAGSWRETAPDESAEPPCCGWDDEAWTREPKCPPGFVGPGPGTSRLDYWGPSNGAMANSGGHACECAPTRFYTWDAPRSCRMLAWDAAGFCALLGNRTLALVGDSTMKQAASTLMNVVVAGGGGCAHRILMAHGDTLVFKNFGMANRGRHWLDVVREDNPDIVVLGAGPHIRNDTDYDFVFERVLSQIKHLPPDVAARYAPAVPDRPLVVLWKTISGGGCLAPHASVAMTRITPDTTACYTNDAATQYNHHQFLDRDWRTLDRLRDPDASGGRLSGLDVRMLYWRTDAHVGGGGWGERKGTQHWRPPDCLHFCLRSEVLSSTFPRVLLHELARRERALDEFAARFG